MAFHPGCIDTHEGFKNSSEIFGGYCENSESWDNSGPGENGLSNMQGTVFNISVVVQSYELFDTHAVTDSSGRLVLRPCITLDLLLALQIAMNFTPNLKGSSHWGYYDADKSEWLGMIGSLLHNDSDFTVSSAVVMPIRRTVVDFNVYINAWKFVAIYRTPNFSHDRLACLRPFKGMLWLAIVSGIVSLTLILFTIASFHSICNPEGRSAALIVFPAQELNSVSALDCIFWPLNLICSKAVYHIPKKFSVRIALLAGSLAGLVFNVAYSGTLISFLSVALGSFKSFEQLLETGFTFDTKAVIQFGMLKASSSPSVMEAVRRIPRTPTYEDMAQAKENLLEGSYAFITHDFSAYEALNKNFTEKERCSVSQVAVPMEKVQLGTMIRKNHPLKRVIDYQILKAKDFGLNNCWLRRHIPKKPVCAEVGQRRDGIPLSSILFSVWVLESGFVFSLTILLLEKMVRVIIPELAVS